jgi:NADH-quinone oxidoreductase subunit L
MFHLTTHAFFKALLFLGAGSVILALHHEQDIWNMGGLRKKLPATWWTFLFGTLALAGLWPFSGFFSKDSILAQALVQHSVGFFVLAGFVAMLTTFYMFRLLFVVFYGAKKSEAADHAHESPGVMLWPLRILAVLSFIGGFIGIEPLYHRAFGSVIGEPPVTESFVRSLFAPFREAPVAALFGLLAIAVGFGAAYILYANADKDPIAQKYPPLSRLLRNRFYLDEIYQRTVIKLHDRIAAIAGWIDSALIDGVGIGTVRWGTDFAGRWLRLVQSGNLQAYAILFALGVALVLWMVLK